MEKKYALKLGEGGRIFYATSIEFAPQDAVYVENLVVHTESQDMHPVESIILLQGTMF